jgi:hypothetical protein
MSIKPRGFHRTFSSSMIIFSSQKNILSEKNLGFTKKE